MRDNALPGYAGPWHLGELEADRAFEGIIEDTLPSAIPITPTGIDNLVDQLTPLAMERVNAQIKASITAPTAFPQAMFDAIEQGFRFKMALLLTERMADQSKPRGEEGTP